MCRFSSEPDERDSCALAQTCPSSRYAIAVDAITAALASCGAHGLLCEEYSGAAAP